jgi:hypothetical protein
MVTANELEAPPMVRGIHRHSWTRIGVTSLVAATALVGATLAPGAAHATPSSPHVSSPLTITPGTLNFRGQRVGTFFLARAVRLANTASTPITINNIAYRSGNADDFAVATDCFASGHPATLAGGASCLIDVVYTPRALGKRVATIGISSSTGPTRIVTLEGVGTEGYYLARQLGGVSHYGDAVSKGQIKPTQLTAPIVSITTNTFGSGYWLLGADGGVFAFGSSRFFGSTGSMHLNQPVVGMAGAPGAHGYWLAARDGGIFTFGKSRYFGSTGAIKLNQPIVGIAATATGKGYWLVAGDGGIFAFGDAHFLGSTGAIKLNQPIVGMAPTPSGKGYWLVARDGGLFAFGDAHYFGSNGSAPVGQIAGMAATPDGLGYWMSNTVGQVFKFGDAPYYGDAFRRGMGSTLALGIAATAPRVKPGVHRTIVAEASSANLSARVAAMARASVYGR